MDMEKIILKNGVTMPMEGFGVLQLKSPALCESCVGEALRAGYRLIDTAAAYFNEEAVGNAVKESGISRDEIFLTTKLWIQDTGYERTKQAVEQSIRRLGTDYLDLYLIHHPFGDYYDAWRAMEALYQEGKIRAIGVSNFDGARLADLCLNSSIAPMVNQVELHPFYQQPGALQSMKEYQVQPEGWAPLCEGQKLIFQNKVFGRIGKKYGKTAAQVILRWNVQRGVVVIPGSSVKEHIRENMDIWDFQLSDADMKAIEQFDQKSSEIVDFHTACTAKWLNEWRIHE